MCGVDVIAYTLTVLAAGLTEHVLDTPMDIARVLYDMQLECINTNVGNGNLN